MTDLPIDYKKAPWRHKYLDEETLVLNRWFIFGESKDGTIVDISDGNLDVFINVPREIAEEIIKVRDTFIDVVIKYFGM